MRDEATKPLRAHRQLTDARRGRGPALRVVTRSAPVRPRWGRIYGAILLVLITDVGAHALVSASAIRTVDAVAGVAVFAVLAAWTHANRVALSRLDEPDAGADHR